MAKSSNQKLKLLYLMKFFLTATDEEHPLTVNELAERLAEKDIKAERKSLYDDIETLRLFGFDIICEKSKKTGYYIGSREFELPELKLLADAVASSKFITEKKSRELIKKLSGLSSAYQADSMKRQIFVINRLKKGNEKIYYNIDEIHRAISENREICFKYFDFNERKEKIYRGDGKRYVVSPLALVWDDENYYLLADYENHSGITHFRVDKIEDIEETGNKRNKPQNFELERYKSMIFEMWGGEVKRVKLRFSNDLASVAIDRFGKDVSIQREKDSFTISAEIAVSPTFFSYIFKFGGKVKIVSPKDVKAEYDKMLCKCIDANNE